MRWKRPNEAWESFIHLKRIYTVREVQARAGYILHDLHEDDEQVEIVEFSSSQIESDGLVIGYYDGNRRERTKEEGLNRRRPSPQERQI
ncbi:MAG: hypothetical protein ACLTTZ_05580 [Lachnospiraceae bacterium]